MNLITNGQFEARQHLTLHFYHLINLRYCKKRIILSKVNFKSQHYLVFLS